jgi:hypothetical protein
MPPVSFIGFVLAIKWSHGICIPWDDSSGPWNLRERNEKEKLGDKRKP